MPAADHERPVERRCGMTVEDQVAVMFARANPAPTFDLLDPIEEKDIDRLSSESERSSLMMEIDTSKPETDAQPGRRPVFGTPSDARYPP